MEKNWITKIRTFNKCPSTPIREKKQNMSSFQMNLAEVATELNMLALTPNQNLVLNSNIIPEPPQLVRSNAVVIPVLDEEDDNNEEVSIEPLDFAYNNVVRTLNFDNLTESEEEEQDTDDETWYPSDDDDDDGIMSYGQQMVIMTPSEEEEAKMSTSGGESETEMDDDSDDESWYPSDEEENSDLDSLSTMSDNDDFTDFSDEEQDDENDSDYEP